MALNSKPILKNVGSMSFIPTVTDKKQIPDKKQLVNNQK